LHFLSLDSWFFNGIEAIISLFFAIYKLQTDDGFIIND